jgi:NHL repeat
MPLPIPERPRRALGRAVRAPVPLLLVLAVLAGPAHAQECPGASPCPYLRAEAFSAQGRGVLRQPQAVALDHAGNVYVGDRWTYRIQKFDSSGRFLTEWGSHGIAPGQFIGGIGGLGVDASGYVYALDSDRDRVQKFASDGASSASAVARGTARGGSTSAGRAAWP